MFNNIGEKIKGLASFICGVGIVVSVIVCIAIIAVEDNLWFVGLIVAVAGSLISWVSSFLLYGFGQLIYTNEMILAKVDPNAYMENVRQTAPAVPPVPHVKNEMPTVHQWRCENCGKLISKEICPFCGKAHGSAAERIEALSRLLQNGTITAEDYEKRVEKMRYE